MRKAASIFLRADIMPEDVKSLVRWMENPAVTRYLNEEPDVTCSLRRILQTVPAPILTFQFNRQGRFFMACCPGGDTIGFVKLREMAEQGTYEIVYAIGEETLWGNGYGEGTIRSALFTAFLEWRARKIVAKICPGNQRSYVQSNPADSEGKKRTGSSSNTVLPWTIICGSSWGPDPYRIAWNTPYDALEMDFIVPVISSVIFMTMEMESALYFPAFIDKLACEIYL